MHCMSVVCECVCVCVCVCICLCVCVCVCLCVCVCVCSLQPCTSTLPHRLSPAGFYHSFLFNEFIGRYRHLSTDFQIPGNQYTLPNTPESVQHLLASISCIVDDIDVSDDNFAIGTSKVFLK